MPRFTSSDWYETPLYYDIVFASDDGPEGRFLQSVHREYAQCAPARGRPKALEPACGSGRLLLELTRRGFAVTGFDANVRMRDFAGARLARAGQRARIVAGALERFDVGTGFELAHCMVNSFKYLLDERAAQAHLECVARALAPGGVYVIGIHLTDYADRRRNHERWTARRGPVEVVCNIQGWPAVRRTRLERVRSRLCVVEAGVIKRTESEWLFRTYDLAQWRRLVRRVPAFELAASFDFTYDVSQPRALPDDQLDIVFVLRKRS